jgi:hypothetical protein
MQLAGAPTLATITSDLLSGADSKSPIQRS